MLRRTGFKTKVRKPLKRTAIKKVGTSPSVTTSGSETKKKRKVRSPMQKLKDQLWEECKRITKRDHGDTCYSCGAYGLSGSNWQTGHFIPSSISSVAIRYSLKNLRPQCMMCNIHRSGNWVGYEAHLIVDFGRDYPDELKKENEATKNKQYDILWYQAKLDEYRLL